MPSPRKVFLPLGTALCLTIAASSAAGKPRSTSTSRQFLVYGAEIKIRGAMCDLAERTKAGLLRLLGLSDDWKTPLVINLDYRAANVPDAPAAQFELSQLGYGLKLQLSFLVDRDIKGRTVERELLRAILVEMMYRQRGNIPAGVPYVTPPDWLVEGMLASQPGRDCDEDAALLRTVVASKKIAPFEDVVRQQRAQLDAPSQQFHAAYSWALVQLLLDAPDGRSRLARFITDLPDAPNDQAADLRVHFPETLGRAAGKWWALSVAQLSARDRYAILGAGKTAAQLDRALRFSIHARDGSAHTYSLGDYETFRKLPAESAVLRQVNQQLLLLEARAHPSYRRIIEEESELAALLARGKTRGVAERLQRLGSYRAAVERQSSQIVDYLNWYEATQSKKMSGAFSPLLENAPSAEEAPPRRRDPISVYLDSIEMETN